jgi:hypothetical protein
MAEISSLLDDRVLRGVREAAMNRTEIVPPLIMFGFAIGGSHAGCGLFPRTGAAVPNSGKGRNRTRDQGVVAVMGRRVRW